MGGQRGRVLVWAAAKGVPDLCGGFPFCVDGTARRRKASQPGGVGRGRPRGCARRRAGGVGAVPFTSQRGPCEKGACGRGSDGASWLARHARGCSGRSALATCFAFIV